MIFRIQCKCGVDHFNRSPLLHCDHYTCAYHTKPSDIRNETLICLRIPRWLWCLVWSSTASSGDVMWRVESLTFWLNSTGFEKAKWNILRNNRWRGVMPLVCGLLNQKLCWNILWISNDIIFQLNKSSHFHGKTWVKNIHRDNEFTVYIIFLMLSSIRYLFDIKTAFEICSDLIPS